MNELKQAVEKITRRVSEGFEVTVFVGFRPSLTRRVTRKTVF